MPSRVCEHCGVDAYFTREFPRVRDEAVFWRNQAKKYAAQAESLRLEAEFERFRDRTDVAWLQGKVVAQRRELNRLNDAFNARRIREDVEPREDKEVSSITQIEIEVPVTTVPKKKLKLKEE